MTSLQKLVLEFVAVDGMSSSVTAMTKKLAGMGDAGKKAAEDISRGVEQMARGWKQLASAQALGNRFVMPGMQAAGTQEAALNRLLSSMEGGGSAAADAMALEQARQAAASIAKVTKFNSTDVIDQAITEQLRAGLKMDDILRVGGGAQSAAYLAQAEGTDVGTANQAILTVVNKFGLVGDEVGKAADSLKRFSGASSASVASLNEGLSYITSAKDLGIGLEDTLGVLGMLDLRGIKGSMGGTSFNEFLTRLTRADQKVEKLDFYDEKGNFKGLDDATGQLRQYFGGMTSEKQQLAAQKLFGDQGSRVLFALLQTEGEATLEAVRAASKRARTLDESVGIMAKGSMAAWEAAAGTAQDALATIFTPMNEPSAKVATSLGDLASTVNEWADQDTHAAWLSGLAVAGVGGVAMAGAMNLARGGAMGLRGLRAASGLLGTASGVAEGKALEAAAGVTPVFVTNWPGSLGGGVAGEAAGAAAAAGGAGLGSRAVAAGGIALAGGYAAGTLVNDNVIKGTFVEKSIQKAMLLGMASLDFYSRGLVGGGEYMRAAKQQSTGVEGLKEMLGLKVTVNVDQKGDATVISEGVDNVEVAANRRGGS
jgi:TP901 family phage tail tape measure protein